MARRWGFLRCAAPLVAAALVAPASGWAATLVYGTDFEAPAFHTGPVGDAFGLPASGQDGWRASPREPFATAPSPWVTVTTARAASGSQSVQLRMDDSFFNGVNGQGPSLSRSIGGPGGFVTNSPTDVSSTSMKLFLDQTAASDVTWSLGFYSGGVLAMGVTIDPRLGQLRWAHTFMNTSAVYSPGFSLLGHWLDLKLERDATDWTVLRLTVSDGSHSFSTAVSPLGGPWPTLVFNANMPTFPSAVSRGTAYVDDVRLGYNLAPVPEPATALMALAGAALLAGVQRRRLRS